MFSKVKHQKTWMLSVGSGVGVLVLTVAWVLMLTVGSPSDLSQAHESGGPCRESIIKAAITIEFEVILFEHANFHGAHKHVFTCEDNLNSSDDSFYNDKTSSIIVISGYWNFYRDSRYRGFTFQFGPGAYPTLPALNDDITSLCVVELGVICP